MEDQNLDTGAPAGAGTPQQATGNPQTQQTTAPAWHDSIQDENLKAFIAGKGFKDAGEAARALQELEGKSAVPESVEAYKLPVPEGQDAAFAGEAAKWMHEAGIPVAQAQALAQRWNQYQQNQQAAFEQTRAQQGEADVATLKKEWGAQYDANVELGRRAVRSFGIDAGALEGISQALGDAQTMRLFQRIGSHLGEGSLGTQSGSSAPARNSEQALTALMFPSMAK